MRYTFHEEYMPWDVTLASEVSEWSKRATEMSERVRKCGSSITPFATKIVEMR